MTTHGQNREVQDLLSFFEYGHLPPDLQMISEPLGKLAHEYAKMGHSAELVAGLRLLLMAKDSFVRAALLVSKPSQLTRQDVPAP